MKECEERLVASIEAYEKFNSLEDSPTTSPFEDSLAALVYEMDNIMKNNTLGSQLESSICVGLQINEIKTLKNGKIFRFITSKMIDFFGRTKQFCS